MMLCSGTRCQEIGDEDESKQTIDNDAYNRRGKNATLAVRADTEQSHDSKHQTCYHEY